MRPFPAAEEVHVWRRQLFLSDEHLRTLGLLLCDAERERAARYRFPRDRRRFTVARATLRILLGRYLGIEPQQVSLTYLESGKPALNREAGCLGLEFNVSHSHELAIYAFARERPVGIDVEYLCCSVDCQLLAERFYSAREVKALRRVPPSARQRAFLNAWTRKEAYIKATGDGLRFPLDQFEVSLVPGEPARLLRVDGSPEEVARWWMTELDVGKDYVAALVVEGEGLEIRMRDV